MASKMTDSQLEAVKSFPIVAGEFCQLIENHEGYTRKHMVDNVLMLLSRLWAIGAQLPDLEPATEGHDFTQEEVKRHSEECVKHYTALRTKLADLDTYWSVFDPTEQEQSAPGSLSADLAEIYLDLRDSIGLLSSGQHINDVYWEWKFDFREHWARHAVEALKVAIFISPVA